MVSRPSYHEFRYWKRPLCLLAAAGAFFTICFMVLLWLAEGERRHGASLILYEFSDVYQSGVLNETQTREEAAVKCRRGSRVLVLSGQLWFFHDEKGKAWAYLLRTPGDAAEAMELDPLTGEEAHGARILRTEDGRPIYYLELQPPDETQYE